MKSALVFSIFAAFSTIAIAQQEPSDTQFLIQIEILNVGGDTGFGLELGGLKNGGVGWVGSLKMKAQGAKDSGINYGTAKNAFNDTEKGSKYGLYDLSLGRTYGFNENFFVSASGVYESYKRYAEFYDKFRILGDNGTYYVLTDNTSQFAANIKAYYAVPNSSLCFSIGYQTGYVGTFVGFGWAN